MSALAGGFVLVVGPSGAGKDTLIGLARKALAADPAFAFPRRLITRAPDRWEDSDALSWEGFERGEREGAYALSWRAHGLGYALPETARDAAEAGRVVVCNVSRGMVEEARRRLPRVTVVEVTAPREVLAVRLAERRRESATEAMGRLRREAPVQADLTIVNDRDPRDGAAALVAHLCARASRPIPRSAPADHTAVT